MEATVEGQASGIAKLQIWEGAGLAAQGTHRRGPAGGWDGSSRKPGVRATGSQGWRYGRKEPGDR